MGRPTPGLHRNQEKGVAARSRGSPEAIKIKRQDCPEGDPLSIDRQMAGARAAKAAQGAQPGGSGRRSLPALERPEARAGGPAERPRSGPGSFFRVRSPRGTRSGCSAVRLQSAWCSLNRLFPPAGGAPLRGECRAFGIQSSGHRPAGVGEGEPTCSGEHLQSRGAPAAGRVCVKYKKLKTARARYVCGKLQNQFENQQLTQVACG